MQHMLLISLSAQVEYLVQSMARVNVEIVQGFEQNRTKTDNIERNMEKIDCKVNDLGVAIAKTSRFDTRIQNDSQAVLTRVSEKCSTIENLVVSGIKANQTITKQAKDVNKAEQSENDAPKKKEARKEPAEDLSNRNKKKKIVWVGTSLSKHLIKSKLEDDLKVDLKVDRAYCIENEPDAHFRERNFRAVVPKAIENENVETLVLQTGSIEITNINVSKATKNPKKNIEEYKKKWFAKVEDNSENLFEVAERALKNSTSLKRVIIVKRLPRFDLSKDDDLGIKSELSNYANACYQQLWVKRGRPENIYIVQLDGLDSSNYIRKIVYGETNKENYDGVHLRGPHAARHLTYRVVQAIKSIITGSSEQQSHRNNKDNHRDCPQAQFQSQRRSANQRTQNNGQSQSKGSNSGHQSSVRYSDVVAGRRQYSVPVANRFKVLGN